MVSRIFVPESCWIGVVITAAVWFRERIISTAVFTLSSVAFDVSVRLKITVPAYSIWLLKNSPKFFMYILHFVTSTTVVKLFNFMSTSFSTFWTALITSESFPTPEGSIMILSGLYFWITSFKATPKSPTREQQIQPEFISRISIPASFKKPPSIPISPNSFSINTTCSPLYASLSSFLIKVVFPAPRKPEKISIFVMFHFSLLFL